MWPLPLLFDKQQAAGHFHVRRIADNAGIIAPNWNVAPGDPPPEICRSHDTGERDLVMMQWGIVPRFAKTEDEFKALSTINAKSDGLTDSKMWREPFAKRRCLVPAGGLYEWPREGHAISPTYTPEPVADETPAAFGDLFGTPPTASTKKVRAASPPSAFSPSPSLNLDHLHPLASGTRGSGQTEPARDLRDRHDGAQRASRHHYVELKVRQENHQNPTRPDA